MTTRERNLTVAVAAVLGVAAVGFISFQLVLSPLIEKGKQIQVKRNEIAQLENEILDIQLLKKKFESQRQQSLPGDPKQGAGMAREQYNQLLIGLCRRADLTDLKVMGGEPDGKSAPTIAPKKPAYTKLTWDLTAKGDLYHVVDFLRLLYSQPLLHTVKSITVRRPAAARSRQTRELDVNLKVEALVLDNAPPRPTLLPIVGEIALASGPAAYTAYNFAVVQNGRGSPVPPEDVLASTHRDYLAIAGKNMFFGKTPKPPAEPEKPPEDDISQFIVLTSIVGRDDGSFEAMFRDALNNNDYTITQSPTGAIAVKGEYELRGQKRSIFGYSERRPGQNLFYGTEDGGNLRVWRVRRVMANEVILEMADPPEEDEDKPKPPALAFVGGGVGAFVDVPEGKMYRVAVGECLATDVAEDRDPLHPLPTKLLRREAFRAIFAPLPASAVSSASPDRRP